MCYLEDVSETCSALVVSVPELTEGGKEDTDKHGGENGEQLLGRHLFSQHYLVDAIVLWVSWLPLGVHIDGMAIHCLILIAQKRTPL